MAKTLTVTVTVPLPEDHFEAAEIMASVKAPLETFRSAVAGHGTVKAEVVTQRKAKEAGAAPRRRASGASAASE